MTSTCPAHKPFFFLEKKKPLRKKKILKLVSFFVCISHISCHTKPLYKFIYIILLSDNMAITRMIHRPRLDTVLMVEDTIKKLKYYPTKNQLWRALPKSVMWQTFNVILEYLIDSRKIIIDKTGEVVWIFADNKKIKKLLAKAKPYRRGKK